MKEGGVGGANTLSGLKFEKDTDLKKALLQIKGITIKNLEVFNKGKIVGYILQKHNLYKNFLEKKGVNWKKIISKKLLPDESFFNIKTNKLIIIEKKWQQIEGSVDEKLQTCDFKKKQYEKLCNPISVKVLYIYILNDWFKKENYKDVLSYIKNVGCHYYYNQLPLDLLDLN
jgi:hypothetical protein